jgi:hypothetical protein
VGVVITPRFRDVQRMNIYFALSKKSGFIGVGGERSDPYSLRHIIRNTGRTVPVPTAFHGRTERTGVVQDYMLSRYRGKRFRTAVP